jgi:hypothetical protein
MNEEQTLQGITEESAPEELQQTDASAEDSQVAEAQSDELPEKFKGKSAAEIARAALEAEKRMHDSTQESASIRRQLQETQQRIYELQSQYQQRQQQEVDPLEEIAKEWDEDPKQALIKGLRKQQESLAQREQRLALEMRSKQGTEYYYKEKQANPDFAQRETDMVEFSRKYGHLIKPEYAQSQEVMEALYFMARGSKVSEYEKAAVDRARKQQEKIKEEKRNAVSERSGALSTPNTDGVDVDDFARMTPKQQEEELEKLARKIGRL